MALDKQRILSELGSVMNQLQSADCGCMGKLFSNNGHSGGNMQSQLPTCGGCRRGWCNGHGYGNNNYGTPSAGEPYSMNNNNMNRPCMGHCNPPKLYADTYNYLNENLMQPVVKDVYNDLKTITPANTVTNNPMASQMGLSPQADNMMGQNQMHGNAMENQNMSNMPNNMNTMPNNQQQMGQMGQMGHMAGMGPNIVNMMMGDGRSKPTSQGHGGQLTESMIIDAPQSPHGQVGVTPLTPPRGANSGQYNFPGMGQANPGSEMQNPMTQYMQQPQQNMYGGQGAPMSGHVMQNPGTQQLGQAQMSPAAQQMTATNPAYGQHAPGITKFNEMFPGVMQGGDLGFDPMAIAIQMNPANHQKAAMDTMQKMMSGNRLNSAMQPPVSGVNAANSQLQPVQSLAPNNQMMTEQQPTGATIPSQPSQIVQQPDGSNIAGASQLGRAPQQVYTAHTGAPIMNQQALQQQIQNQPPQQYQQQAQQIIDPNTGAPMTPNSETYDGTTESNAQMQQQPPAYNTPQSETPYQPMIKDPIFPADTSRNVPSSLLRQQKYFQYNTLGQPVEMLPANMYQIPEAKLPQTLSPQPATIQPATNQSKLYSNVKATISKTSLMGNRPVGRVPSRGQLQQIYNQYKGSQSYTRQNINAPQQGGSYSEGKLNVPHGNQQVRQEVPIERVGGDSIANNQLANKMETVVGQKGDVPAVNKPGEEIKANPAMPSKCRNGLQDMIYTSYPTSAAWSFHGDNAAPFPTSYNFRSRV